MGGEGKRELDIFLERDTPFVFVFVLKRLFVYKNRGKARLPCFRVFAHKAAWRDGRNVCSEWYIYIYINSTYVGQWDDGTQRNVARQLALKYFS